MTRKAAVRESSSNYVTVACKIPNGIELQIFKPIEVRESAPGGGSNVVKVFRPHGPKYKIHGTSRYPGQSAPCSIVMGYALTKNIPTDVWEHWLEANKDSAMVQNNLIFASPDMDNIRDEAKDNRERRSNMEPLNPSKDLRSDALSKRKLKIQTAKESSTPDDSQDFENIEADED